MRTHRTISKRATILILAGLTLLVVLGVVYGPGPVDKPVKDGHGPLAVYISPRYAAPEYHSPLEFWQTHHWEAVNRGDVAQQDCLYCHEPQRSCNNCHSYVGAAAVVVTTPVPVKAGQP